MTNLQTKRSDRDRRALRRLLVALEEFRKIDAEMPIQQAVIFLNVAIEEGISLRAVAAKVGQAHSSVSRNVAALGEMHRLNKPGHNLIITREDPADRRQKNITLTHNGNRILRTLVDAIIPPDGELEHANS